MVALLNMVSIGCKYRLTGLHLLEQQKLIFIEKSSFSLTRNIASFILSISFIF